MKIVPLLVAALLPVSAFAGPLQLTPANPQPSGVKAGLGVSYFDSVPKIRTLSNAEAGLKNKKPGKPLQVLNFETTERNKPVLTSSGIENVAADIRGYVKFDAPGVYTVALWSNDGVKASLGGQQIAYMDEITACTIAGEVEVNVPSAGWYDFSAIYFQKQGGFCLIMEWGKGDDVDVVPASAFGH